MNLGKTLEGQPVPTEMCDVYFMAEALSQLTGTGNIQGVLDYIIKLPKTLEGYTLSVILRRSLGEELLCTPSIRRWASVNSEILGVGDYNKNYARYLNDNHLCAVKRGEVNESK